MSLMDPTFRYYRAAETDIRRTFKRIRAQQKNAAAKQAEQSPKVRQLRKQEPH